MTTNLDVIRSALQSLGVISEVQEPSAEQASHAFTVLNDFLEDWSGQGIDVGQWPQTSLDASFPASSDVVLTAKNTLAIHLAPHYERQPHPATVVQADKGFARLLRDTVVSQLQASDMTHMPVGEGQRVSWNIQTGE